MLDLLCYGRLCKNCFGGLSLILKFRRARNGNVSDILLNLDLGVLTWNCPFTWLFWSHMRRVNDKSNFGVETNLIFWFVESTCLFSSQLPKAYIQGGIIRLYTLVSSNINRFSKLFDCEDQDKICNNTITKDPTTPQMCRYTTLWNEKCLRSNKWNNTF